MMLESLVRSRMLLRDWRGREEVYGTGEIRESSARLPAIDVEGEETFLVHLSDA